MDSNKYYHALFGYNPQKVNSPQLSDAANAVCQIAIQLGEEMQAVEAIEYLYRQILQSVISRTDAPMEVVQNQIAEVYNKHTHARAVFRRYYYYKQTCDTAGMKTLCKDIVLDSKVRGRLRDFMVALACINSCCDEPVSV